MQVLGGGKGANQAVAAARLGARTAIAACVGDDAFGLARVAELQTQGVRVKDVAVLPGRPSGAALIMVDSHGENLIAVAAGANDAMSPDHVRAAQADIRQARVLVCQLEVPLAAVRAALEIAQEGRAYTVLNAAPASIAVYQLLPLVHILVVNESEATVLSGTQVRTVADAQTVAAQLVTTVRTAAIITLGAQGCVWAEPEGVYYLPAYSVPVVDTTAAGDAFVGGLAAALCRGETLGDAVRYASAAAALTVQQLGAQPSLPTHEAVALFLQNRPRPGE